MLFGACSHGRQMVKTLEQCCLNALVDLSLMWNNSLLTSTQFSPLLYYAIYYDMLLTYVRNLLVQISWLR